MHIDLRKYSNIEILLALRYRLSYVTRANMDNHIQYYVAIQGAVKEKGSSPDPEKLWELVDALLHEFDDGRADLVGEATSIINNSDYTMMPMGEGLNRLGNLGEA